ncbi:MAG: DUF4416 family protein [Desulfarculaceae bacterium]|jgi:hypothetical protein
MMSKEVTPARLVISLLFSKEEMGVMAIQRLQARFGALVFLSGPKAFDYTDYYQKEMGAPLTRRLAAFLELVEPHRLAVVKRICMSLETDLSVAGRRQVNLDPGLLSSNSLVLASTKASPHRLCLSPGLYGELTLLFHQGQYHPLPWTYPDYAGEELRGILLTIRRRYLWQLKNNPVSGDDSCPSP